MMMTTLPEQASQARALFADPTVIWAAIGALSAMVSAGILFWYTRITSQLLKVTDAANQPFLTITFDSFNLNRTHASLYLRNVGASPALDIKLRIVPPQKGHPLPEGVAAQYTRDLVSPHGGQTRLVEWFPIASLSGFAFYLSFRDGGGRNHQAPAPLICDPADDSLFRWGFEDEP